MTGSGDVPDPLAGSDPIAELEAFIAQTEARGEPVPPEARVMLARLRELMAALRGLSESFERRGPPPPTTDSEGDSGGD